MRNIRNLKFRIYGFGVRCTVIIKHGLHGKHGRTAIFRRLKKELMVFRSTVRLSDGEVNDLWRFCVGLYNFILAESRSCSTEYDLIRASVLYLERFEHGFGRIIEERDKKAYLRGLLQSGVFYLCSYHTNCAEGHFDFQGKIYVSSKWRERCTDAKERRMVAAYIRNHRCDTIESVIGEPVYMVLRPNCRHFFIEVGVDEVLHNSRNKLLRKYGMVYVGVSSYEYSQYRKYYERLKVLLALRKVCPCDRLERDISNTRKLIKKWLTMVDR